MAILHVAKLTSVADYLVLCSGDSERQVRAIADHVDQALSSRRHPPISIEGAPTAQWILMDFGDVVFHVFREDVREHYALERLWADAPRVRLTSKDATPATPVRRPLRRQTVRAREAR